METRTFRCLVLVSLASIIVFLLGHSSDHLTDFSVVLGFMHAAFLAIMGIHALFSKVD